MIRHLLALLVLVTATATAAEHILLNDDFSDPAKEGRRASRGPWKFEGNVASCTQDDELYKKFKDHGPIIFYDLDYTDAKITFQVKAQGSKTVVFTCNNTGHVFRFVASSAGTSIRAFPPDGNPKSIQLAKGPSLAHDMWIPVTVDLRGARVVLQIGTADPISVEHPSFATAKTNLSIGQSFGTLSVKDVLVTR
mgnify:CR=1 FL=1